MSHEPIRVLYVHNSADLYGASRSLARLMKRLDRTRFVPLVVLPEVGPLQGVLEALGVEVVLHPGLSVITRERFRSWRLAGFFLGFPASVLWLRGLIRRRRIQIVHTNTGVIVSPALAAKIAGAAHVWHIRDWFQEFRPVWWYYERYIRGCSDRVLAVSEAIAGQFSRRDNVEVVHNGFTLDEFVVPREELRREFRAKHNLGSGPVVGCVGRIKLVRKGQEVLLQAAGRLLRRGHVAKYVIVGSPYPGNESHLARLQQSVRELGLNGHVVFTGEMADPRPAYAAMDVFVLPSAQPEPFGGVVMEAMAMGLPVVATAIGGSTDQVADRETGFLVPPSDPEALAGKLELLLTNPALRGQMGQAAPRRVAEHFALDAMVFKLQALYAELAADRKD